MKERLREQTYNISEMVWAIARYLASALEQVGNAVLLFSPPNNKITLNNQRYNSQKRTTNYNNYQSSQHH